MKKELWIINHYATPPGYGGLTRHYYLAKYLNKLGYDVKIFASSAIHNSSFNFIKKEDKALYKETIIEGVKYIHIKTDQYEGNKLARIKNILQFWIRCQKVMKLYYKEKKPDYIYSSSPHPFSPIIANKFAKKKKIESVVEVRDLWPESLIAYNVLKSRKNIIYKILYYIERKMYLNSDKLIFTMNNYEEYLKKQKYYNKIKSKKMANINNGIDFKEYKNNYNLYKIEDKDLENNQFKVVYAGSIRYTYNITMIAELANLLKNEKNIKFLIYGDGTETERLLDYIKKNNLTNIEYKGYVESKYLPYILSKCDLALIHGKKTSISRYGMSTNKSHLYLAAGLPVINVYESPIDEFKEHECGVTLKEYSIEEYKKQILYFYNMSNKEINKYKNNAKTYAKEFDYEKLAKKLKDILEEK